MNDIETKRKRIETLVKFLAVGVTGFFVAPFVFIAIKGLIGLAIAAAVSFITINMIPWFAAKVGNWRLKALKHEAALNPIETLQNNYKDRMQALGQFRDAIISFAGEVKTFAAKLDGYKRDFPKDAPKYDGQFIEMQQLLQQRKVKYQQARASLALYEKEIQRVSADWDMAQAAAKMNKAAGVDADAFFAKIQVETAFDSVQKSLGSAFADLEVSLMDSDGNPPKQLAPAISGSKQLAADTHAGDPLDLCIDVEPVPEPATINRGRGRLAAAVILLCVGSFSLTGCETYKKVPLAPDGLNYTISVDHAEPHATTSYIGVSWSLK